jgi:hypothetical protein
MATTFTNLSTAQVDDMVVGAIRTILPALDMFSLQVLAEPAIVNTVKRVPLSTDPTLVTKTPGTFASTTGALTGVDVTINTFNAGAWDATEGLMSASLMPAYWADKIAGGVYVVAKSIVDAALALVTSGNFGNTEGTDKLTVAVADFGAADVASLRTLAAKKIKGRVKSLMLNSDYAGAISGDSSILSVFGQTGENLLKSGKLPQLGGMISMEYTDLPTNSQSLGGVIFGKAAIAAAVAPFDMLNGSGEGNIVERRMITEPDTGLTVVYTEKVDAGGTRSGEIAALFGVAVGRAADVVRLVSA